MSCLIYFSIYFCTPNKINARMAELVDALVSNTNEVTLVPVRLRLRVQMALTMNQGHFFVLALP